MGIFASFPILKIDLPTLVAEDGCKSFDPPFIASRICGPILKCGENLKCDEYLKCGEDL